MNRLIDLELAKNLRGGKKTRAFTRAFFERFGYEDVKVTTDGLLMVFVGKNAWILEINKNKKIKGVYCYGSKAAALEKMFNK